MENFLIFYWIFSILVTYPIFGKEVGYIIAIVYSVILGWLFFPTQLGVAISKINKIKQ